VATLALALVPALAGCGGGTQAPVQAARQVALVRPGAGPALDPHHLPVLPRDFLAVGRSGATVLVRLDGSVIGHLRGLRLTPLMNDHGPILLGHPRSFAIDRAHRRLAAPGPRPAPSAGLARRVAPASPHGSWIAAFRSPDGKRLLLQWSDECETPYAFLAPAGGGKATLVTGRRALRGAPESFALGWTRDGRALVLLPTGACAGGTKPPGVYAFAGAGSGHLIARGDAAAFFRG
jgi:hypothetical protein